MCGCCNLYSDWVYHGQFSACWSWLVARSSNTCLAVWDACSDQQSHNVGVFEVPNRTWNVVSASKFGWQFRVSSSLTTNVTLDDHLLQLPKTFRTTIILHDYKQWNIKNLISSTKKHQNPSTFVSPTVVVFVPISVIWNCSSSKCL